MRALLLILIASSALGQGRFDRFNQRTDQGRSTRGFEQSSYAFFEFAPASGAGMGTACACTTPTGAKGEALTFTRAGDATCSKQGLATTGIANGDLVACTANQPRVESSGGVLGLRVEGARTNETLRSQEFENVVWATTVSGVAAPTITANFATAPDGALTADRMQIPACPVVGNASGVNQTSGAIASPSSSSVYLKANSGTPSVSVCMYGITTGTRTCTQFALNTSTWTRAVVPNVTNTGGMNMEIACENRTGSYTGATNTGAADILVWGAQSEAGAYATSYIPTVAASATRNADSALTGTLSPGVGPSFCLAGSAEWPSSLVTTGVVAQLGTAAPDLASVGRNTNTAAALVINATTTTPAVAAIGTSVARALLADASGTRSAFWNAGAIAAPAASMTGSPTAVTIGAVDSIVTRVQIDPSPSRCTP